MKKYVHLLLLALASIFSFGKTGSFIAGAQAGAAPRRRPFVQQEVRLVPVPPGATAQQIKELFTHNHNLYFKPGTYNIGILEIDGWENGTIWGAGRLTTTLKGQLIIRGSRNLTIGNFSLQNTMASGEAVADITGSRESKISFLNTLISASKEGIALRWRSPGELIVQGCNLKASDIGLSIEHPWAKVYVIGGNMAGNRIHIQQLQGHLVARAFGMQVNKGDADIVIHTPSPLGYHLIEGLRSEGNNSANRDELLLRVPQTNAAVNVALRANGLSGMLHYADYNANGKLLLIANVNYPAAEDKNSWGIKVHSPGPSRILSYGNKYGLSYDSALGPFDIGRFVTVQSMGDLWMLPNTTDYKKNFDEPITAEAMQKAGKMIPRGLQFLDSNDVDKFELPDMPGFKTAAFPKISNLGELMLNVKNFGAVPNDGKDDYAALQRALDSAVINRGISEPLYFPAGVYELSQPLLLDHLAGGGFWGEGMGKTILLSTTGKGVLYTDGAGYASFVDISFKNKEGAGTKTTDFNWVNSLSADKRRPNTGAALQANMFYRVSFENGIAGITVGRNKMGDGFMLVGCMFKNIHNNGTGAGFISEGYNALTNPIINSKFDNLDCAVIDARGSFNFYGNQLTNITKAGLEFRSIVGNGFAIVNNTMDASPVPFIVTGHSSSKAHLLVDNVTVQPPAKQAKNIFGTQYNLGGSMSILHSDFRGRSLSNAGGIGDNT